MKSFGNSMIIKICNNNNKKLPLYLLANIINIIDDLNLLNKYIIIISQY